MTFPTPTEEEFANHMLQEKKCSELAIYLLNPPAGCIISSLKRTLSILDFCRLEGLTGAEAWTTLQQKGQGEVSKTGNLPTIDSSAHLKEFLENDFLTRMSEEDPIIDQFNYKVVSRGEHYYECFELKRTAGEEYEISICESVNDVTAHVTNGKQSSSGLGWYYS